MRPQCLRLLYKFALRLLSFVLPRAWRVYLTADLFVRIAHARGLKEQKKYRGKTENILLTVGFARFSCGEENTGHFKKGPFIEGTIKE